jgi:hypothetical protein
LHLAPPTSQTWIEQQHAVGTAGPLIFERQGSPQTPLAICRWDGELPRRPANQRRSYRHEWWRLRNDLCLKQGRRRVHPRAQFSKQGLSPQQNFGLGLLTRCKVRHQDAVRIQTHCQGRL